MYLLLMSLFSKIIYSSRIKKLKKSKTPKLKKNPQKKAICLRVLTMSPTKPNSANRRIVKAIMSNSRQKLTAKITGESHNLQQHSTVLFRGAKMRDLIGINYALIRSKYDLGCVSNRKKSRSLFGVKKS
jgi:small subunit ribosomal protein S12